MRRQLPLSGLGRDRRGISTIELGLCMPIFSVVLLGLIDISSVYSAQISLQQAATRSLERLQVSADHSDFAYVKAEAAAAAGVPESQVEIRTWLECNNVKQAEGTSTCAGTEVAGKYVEVEIESSFEPNFPYSPVGEREADGTVTLTATASQRYG